MQTLARFVIRPASDKPAAKGDLLIGALFKYQDHSVLAPGVIYEIINIDGTLIIKPVGPAAIGHSAKDGPLRVCWGNEFSYIVTTSGGQYLLSREEAMNMLNPKEPPCAT
jgi:hypothetical protein